MSTEEAPQTEPTDQKPIIVQLELELQQVNFILNTLSQLPFKDSAGLIHFIRNQAISQLENVQKEADNTLSTEMLQ